MLRQRIVTGEWTAGSRLPNRAAMMEEFGVSIITVQRAMTQLAEEGFVRARGRLGSFVSDAPPHQNRYAFVLPFALEQVANQQQMYAALLSALRKFQDERGLDIVLHFGISGRAEQRESRQLIEDIQSRRYAGVIFGCHPYPLLNTPVLKTDVAKVAIMAGLPTCECSAVYPDVANFFDRALDFLAHDGRQRVAVLNIGFQAETEEALTAKIREHGMTSQAHWRHYLNPNCHEGIRRVAQLLMSGAPDERPDAIMITDDNLTSDVTAGLLASQVDIPNDLRVLSLCNYPALPRAFVPTTLLGFDCVTIIEHALAEIDRLQQGGHIQQIPSVLAQFKGEWEATTLHRSFA